MATESHGTYTILKYTAAVVCAALFAVVLMFLCDTKADAVSVSFCTVQNISAKTYTGSEIKPLPTVKYAGKTLKRGTDYTISYSNNINAGTAYVLITGKGSYSGTVKKAFTINPAPIISATFYKIPDNYFTGSGIKPVPSIKFAGQALKNGTDFTLSYSNNINLGTAKVSIKGKGNFTGSCSLKFTIVARPVSTLKITAANAEYTGAAVKPAVSVKYGSFTFKNGTDYTLTYKNNVEIGTATVTIKGKGRLTGTKSVTFKVTPIAISKATVSSIVSATYTGNAITPAVTVKLGTKTLKKNTDYTVSYQNNTNAGTATIVVTGKGIYGGTAKKTFTINPASILTATFYKIADKYYTGSAIKPIPTIKFGESALKSGTDFTISYLYNTDIGKAKVTVKGKGNFTGSGSVYFSIIARPLSTASITVASATYNGSAQKPAVSVKYGGFAFASGTDYTLTYKNNINAGTATVTVTGKNHLSGSKAVTFTINRASVSGAAVTLTGTMVFGGQAVTPTAKVTLGGRTLAAGTDYTLSYKNNINAGTASAVITGKGNYTGTLNRNFTIWPMPVENADISVSGKYSPDGVIYTVVARLGEYELTDSDYTFTDPGAAGKHSIVFSGKGNFSGTKTVSCEIAPADLSLADADIFADGSEGGYGVSVSYDGRFLARNTDYTVTFSEENGFVTADISGINNYGGSLRVTAASEVLDKFADVTVASISDLSYTGEYLRPALKITRGTATLTENTDFTAEYYDNLNAGTATVRITGKNNYQGMKKVLSFNITPAGITSCKAVCEDMDYTGSALCPVPTITFGGYTLQNTVDYDIVSYFNNTNVGTGIICIRAKGNFTGSTSISFMIKQKNAEEEAVKVRLDEMMAGEHDRQINAYMHSYKLGNYYNTLLTSPCTCHSYCATGYEDGCTCLIGRSTVLNNSGIQCCGFTLEVFEYLFGGTNGAGENTLTIKRRSDGSWTEEALKNWMTGSFRPGDYLAYDNIMYGYPHYVIVYSVESDGIWVYEANYGGHCKINFRKMSFTEIYEQTDDLWHRTPNNYKLS